jgi:plastocyanin
MPPRVIVIFALALLAGGARAEETATVVIDNFSFKPASITVRAGAHVVFLNRDDAPHAIIIPALKQHSAMLDTDEKFDAAMDRPGKYAYFCGVHPMMTGEIIVTGE